MAILVTGGAGFIGSELVRQLRAEGHEVEVVDLPLDVAAPEVEPGLRRCSLVYHLAATWQCTTWPSWTTWSCFPSGAASSRGAPTRRGYLVTVRGFLERSGARDIVFMKSLESSPGLSPVREVVEQARQAVLDAGAARILPLQELVGEVLPPAQSSTLEEVERTQQQTATAGVTVGPNTIMIGEDMSQAFFVPAGTVNTNINIHTETFVRQREVTTTTLTKTASLDVIGTP